MTAIELLAIINQGAVTLTTLTSIAQDMESSGRKELTDEEVQRVRSLTLASEARLAAAVQS
jgi:hypothetical protein